MNINIREALPNDANSVHIYLKTLCEEKDLFLPMVWEEFIFTIEDEESFLRELFDSENSVFFIAEFESKVIGVVDCKGGLRNHNRHVGVIGISILKDYRNKGIGIQLMNKIINWAKSTNIIKRLELNVFEPNKNAIQLYEKLGFKTEGILKKAAFHNNQYFDDIIMSLLI